jgi:hypothetical protein
MTGYVSKKAFLSDVCQMAAYDRALQSVVDFGYFRINAVVREAGLAVSKGVILWKRIVRLIEEKLKVRMVPVAESFFLGRARNRAVTLLGDNMPERHLATGRRDVAGYVSCGCVVAGSVVEEKAARLAKIGKGFERSADDARGRLRRGRDAQQAEQLGLLEAPA